MNVVALLLTLTGVIHCHPVLKNTMQDTVSSRILPILNRLLELPDLDLEPGATMYFRHEGHDDVLFFLFAWEVWQNHIATKPLRLKLSAQEFGFECAAPTFNRHAIDVQTAMQTLQLSVPTLLALFQTKWTSIPPRRASMSYNNREGTFPWVTEWRKPCLLTDSHEMDLRFWKTVYRLSETVHYCDVDYKRFSDEIVITCLEYRSPEREFGAFDVRSWKQEL